MVSVLIGALDVAACEGSPSKRHSGREMRGGPFPPSHLQPSRSVEMTQTQDIDYDYFISESGRRWQPSASEHSRCSLETIGNRLCEAVLRKSPLPRSHRLVENTMHRMLTILAPVRSPWLVPAR